MKRNSSDEVVRSLKRLKVDNDELLNVVFRFKHKTPSDRQDDSLCETIVGAFAAFVGNLEAVAVKRHHCAHVNPLVDDRIVPGSVFAVHEIKVLREVVRRLRCSGDDVHKRGDVWYDPWLPMYGCAVQKTLVNTTVMKLEVVFVDGWERTLHFLPTGKCVHSAVSKTYNILHCGNLDSVLEEKFGKEFEMKLRKAQEGKGSKRSAVVDDLGHQKTPQFIAAVVRRTIHSVTSTEEDAKEDEKEDISLSPHGGTTDVGQHTGGRPRDTCWHLVQALIKHNLCCGTGLFRKTMVLFRLKMLEKTLEDAEAACHRGVHVKSTCDSVDDLFFMLQVVVQSVIELFDCGYNVSVLQDKCAALRCSIGGLLDTVNQKIASQYRLPDFEMLQQLKELKCDVDIASPKQDRDSTSDESDEIRRCRAVQNLAGCHFINGATCSLSELLRWVRLNAAPKSCKHILALRTIEAFMFTQALRLNGGDGCEPMCDVDDDEIIVEQMQSLVTAYQTVARERRQLPNLTSVLDVEQRSRELLVMWIAFCLVHQKCVDEVPLCTEYNIALNWRDLKVAVLRDSAAIAALEQVAQYIREWNKNSSKPTIFHLTNQEPTFEFARRFGLSSDEMISVYNREDTSWERHVQSKWREIEGKKQVAAVLRSEISDLNQELRSKQRDLAEEVERLCQAYPPGQFSKCYRQSGAKTEFCAEIKQLQADITNTKDRLKNTIATPPPLTRPLPVEKEDAIQVIFMLTMPRNLEILGNLCLTAQRALAPVEPTCEMKDLPNLNPTTWPQFYVQHTQSIPLSATTKEFTVSPAAIYLQSCYVPRTIDDWSNISQFKNQCVNSPLLKGTALTWKDRTGETLNPFKATPTGTISSFIENMPKQFGHLQWMSSWPGENDIRGNLAYSRLHEQPEEFEKAAFIALGSLRAFPNQQYRKLMWSLLEDVLPWSHPCVETVVRQSLYQVGTLTDEEKPKLLWKTDMLRDERGLETFCTMLKMAASKLEQTPRSFENVPLLSELAGYLQQFTGDANEVVRLFARMARSWAETAKSEVGGDRSMVFRQKQSILYGYALLAYSLGPQDDEAAQETCELLVLYRTSLLCANINSPSTDQMLQVESNVDEMMTRRIPELVEYVESRNMNAVLTSLVSLISPTSPGALKWSRVSGLPLEEEQFGSCFDSSGARYAINLFTGVVLTDGNAPGGLPTSIREHERFELLFGGCNFEVFSVNGVFQTESLYCERVYNFALQSDGELFVQELVVDASRTINCTLQLCSRDWSNLICESFPSRLSELYSHWYWVGQNCILFRPREAKDREVFFVATFDSKGALHCCKVPLSDTSCSYEWILEQLPTYDRIVPKDELLDNVVHALTKFEDAQFLHPLMSPKGTLMIELPRFKLMFSLNSAMHFESVEHKGYILATKQQFDDYLPRFSRYLVLELQDRSDITKPKVRMLLPVGAVTNSSSAMIDVGIPCEANSTVDIACYDLHRRLKVFETETISARLQLAAICALAGTDVPSEGLQMTGSEAALQILRACRSSRPFSDFERDHLLTICKLSHREPAVKILAAAWLAEGDRLGFLHGQAQSMARAMSSIDEKTEYSNTISGSVQRNPLRSRFRHEERFIFGQTQYEPMNILPQDLVSLEPPPVVKEYVNRIEAELSSFVRDGAPTTTAIPPLPIKSIPTDAMSKGMLDELKVSWDCYNSLTPKQLKASAEELLGAFSSVLADVTSRRCETEKYLQDAFGKASSSNRDRLLALANFLPQITVSDIVRCAFDEETLYTLTKKLSEQAREYFKAGVLQYMELCVLEDKVERLIWKLKCCDVLSSTQLVNELVNVRRWSTAKYPYWLAFEVEGRLQIRHEQFVIAQHLINGPGTVCQLNMGSGKTRVILPMLFLYFTRTRCQRIVRAHFLGPLLSEARQFMHRYLSASTAQLSIFEQPFHRQIALNPRKLELIQDALHELKMFGGVQLISPEHRMSLELKRLELSHDESIVRILDEILDNDQFVDVLDECDALLHHKYHLVYAVGTPITLCSGTERWKVAEALLRAMVDKSSSSRVVEILQAAHVSCASPDYTNRMGAYDGTRLNSIVDSTRPLREELKRALVEDLIDNAPFELMWLNTFGRGSVRESLVTAISDSSVSLDEALKDDIQKFSPYIYPLLGLRGLVAFGILEHCLEKRYRVDFGLPAPGSRAKKIAIPFRAADVPSERSEFSHPDVSVVLTLLGYYHGGLSDDEVRNAFRMLLRLDISEQQQLYDQWFTSVKPHLREEDLKALCDVRQVSLADAKQFKTLCRVYKFCMELINFFLNTCVFPKDTQQYPQRLSRTAWNLAAGEKSIGFSGTNDNHRLLPLSVTQREPEEPQIVGTNGEMIDKILHVAKSYEVIHPNVQVPIPWQEVLQFAMAKHAQAIIDTGALLAGVTNHEAAEFLLQQPDFKFAGVTYYDNRDDHNCWMVVEKTRHLLMPMKKASLSEKVTFVIFDEARSRGSDMKLPHNASALLTLGPKLTKDKLMQGAGRMRQLGCNQTLWLASFDEVAQSILQSSSQGEISQLTALDVLNWVMSNTKAEAVRGLLEWAGNGIHYRKTQLKRGAELVAEDWSLETLYQSKLSVDKIARVIEARARIGFEDLDDALIAQICHRGSVYGLDDEICVTAHTDECEQELHVEEEQQQEQELEVAERIPAKEKLWDYSRILPVDSVEKLDKIIKVLDMESFVRQWIAPDSMAGLAWSATKIFGTENFFTTITTRRNNGYTNEFLRVIDAMLIFDNGQVLLVSEREADHILELLWSRDDLSECKFRFLNFVFACESVDRVGGSAQIEDVQLVLGHSQSQELPVLAVAGCHVFNGETMLAKHQQNTVQPIYRELLRPLVQRETTLSNFVKSRGSGHKWTRSVLHELCCRMDLEECNC